MGYRDISALRRHLAEVEARLDLDAESGLPHAAHVMATAAIIIDAKAAGTPIDDRGSYAAAGERDEAYRAEEELAA